MTWLYVPPTFLASAPVSEDWNSESDSPSHRLAASVSWRGKLQPRQAWSRRWKQGGFIHALSGLTFSPSTLANGVEAFISSLAATPARTTALPESGPEARASGSLPPKSSASPTSAGLILSSAKTCRGTLASSLAPSSRHWSDWATALRQEYSARPRPETPCGASDCSWLQNWTGPSATDGERGGVITAAMSGTSLAQQTGDWAAPQARDHFPPHSPERIAAMKAEGHGMRNLNDEAANWASPKASDPEKAGPNMRGSKGDVPLPGQAANWPGPMASDDQRKVTKASHQTMLCNFAPDWVESSLPPSSPAQPIAGGSMSSTDGPNSNQPSVKRKLNPIFVEALMRWPTGLSGFERQETAWIRWSLLMQSFVSALCSPKDEPQGTLF